MSKIKILKNGPIVVTGSIPLHEKILSGNGRTYRFTEGRPLPQTDEYRLCRCGKSGKSPFCDGSHVRAGFDGTETASRASFVERADLFEGPELDLLDDHRCAFARLCHRAGGTAWDLLRKSDDPDCRAEAIIAASDCPAGRLVAMEKTGQWIERGHEPEIDIIQDPEKGVSGGIFVKGPVTIEAADGFCYEKRNSVVLCRCGESRDKPFCDATHVMAGFIDEK